MGNESYHQPDLFDVTAARTLHEVRELLCSGPRRFEVDLVLTRNRVRMISVEFVTARSVNIRMHEAFLSAPEEVLLALRTYLRTHRRAAWRIVADYAREIDQPAPSPHTSKRRSVLRHKGRHFDLKEIAGEVNATFFGSSVRYRIGWGKGRSRGRRGSRSRSMRMGSWNPTTREVRIHPLLDDERVPYEFMRYLVYHELLHAVVPSVRGERGRRDHPAEFRLLERRFPEVKRMRRLASGLTEMLLT